MKKILLLAIVFHSFYYSANAMVFEPTKELSRNDTIGWLKAMFEEKIEYMLGQQSLDRQNDFWDSWNKKSTWKAVRDLTVNRSLSAQQQALMIFIDSVLKEEAIDGAFQRVAAEILEKNTDSSTENENFNRDLVESQGDVFFYKIMLASLISDKKFDNATKNQIEFYQEILKDMNKNKPIVEKIMKKYLYLGKFRSFGTTFVEVNFLKKKDTNEIIATEKLIGVRPDSILFCIAEILRSDSFRTLSSCHVRRDQATANPLSIPGEFFGDYEKKDYSEHTKEVLSELERYLHSKKTTFLDKEIEMLIAKSRVEKQYLLPAEDETRRINYIDYQVGKKLYSATIGERLKRLKLYPIVARRQTAEDRYARHCIVRLVPFNEEVTKDNEKENEIGFFLHWESFKADLGFSSVFR